MEPKTNVSFSFIYNANRATEAIRIDLSRTKIKGFSSYNRLSLNKFEGCHRTLTPLFEGLLTVEKLATFQPILPASFRQIARW